MDAPIGNLKREDHVWYIMIGQGYVEVEPAYKDLIREFVTMWYRFDHAGVRGYIYKILRAYKFDHDLSCIVFGNCD